MYAMLRFSCLSDVCRSRFFNRDGATALHFAADGDLVEIATVLLDNGAKINEKTS
jgi:ankyrin repeat protein